MNRSTVFDVMVRLLDVDFCGICDGVGGEGLLGVLPCPVVRLQAHVIADDRARPELSPWGRRHLGSSSPLFVSWRQQFGWGLCGGMAQRQVLTLDGEGSA